MPVYNTEKYLIQAIQSILDQSMDDFELIILNDCSNDNSLRLIEGFKDERIKVINSRKNIGYAKNLNYGIKIATGKYIARMDSDDIALKDRLKKQVEFLESNYKYKLCCGNATVIDKDDFVVNKKMYRKDLSPIEWQLFWTNPVIHPTVLFRKTLFHDNILMYDIEMNPAEDYDLWCKISENMTIYRMDDVLIKYRRLENSQYHSSIKKATEVSLHINKKYIENTLKIQSPHSVHYNVVNYNFGGVSEFSIKNLSELKLWTDLLFEFAYDKFRWDSKDIKLIKDNIYNLNITLIKRISKPILVKVYLYLKFIPLHKLFIKFFSYIINRV